MRQPKPVRLQVSSRTRIGPAGAAAVDGAAAMAGDVAVAGVGAVSLALVKAFANDAESWSLGSCLAISANSVPAASL